MPSKHQVTRVAVDDDTWRAFRGAALERGISVSAYLAKLVDGELRRRKTSPAAAIDPEAPAIGQALDGLAAVRQSIDELDAIAGRLARAAIGQGGSWKDVASSLGLTDRAARDAYARR